MRIKPTGTFARTLSAASIVAAIIPALLITASVLPRTASAAACVGATSAVYDSNSSPESPRYIYVDSEGQECEPSETQRIDPVPTGAGTHAENYSANKGATSCESWTDYFKSPIVCFGRTLGALIATILVTLSAKLLEVVGLLFNWLVYYTIVAFGDQTNGFLTTSVRGAIDTAWTVFRDLSNILIIGLFVFIAISIILGLESFGQKKMIARVLVIAVLMNFSLLFTKLIIDGSNFVSYQFYVAAGGSVVPKPINTLVGAGTSVATTQQQDGIAGQFIRTMGVTSIGDVYTNIRKNAEDKKDGMLALLHGVLSATFLLGVAIVMLYGCLLIISRAVLLIFLMITSSLAFATYLIPKAAESQYGWSTWWKSLINVAVFGPLLMILLWVTLSLAQAMSTQGSTLGGLMTSNEGNAGVGALFNYVILLGMLFASFKLASSFSSGISGFSMAAMIPALGIAAGARVAAFAGRQTIGRASLAASDALKMRAAKATDGSLTQSLYKFGSNRFKGVAKSDMNVMRTPLGGMVGGMAGIDAKKLAGKEIKGFEGSLKERAKKYAEDADALHVDAKKKAAIEVDAIKAEIAKNPSLNERHAAATQAADAHKNEKDSAENEHKVAQEKKVKAELDIARAEKANDAEGANNARFNRAEAEKTLNEQKSRIEAADKRIKEASKVIENIETEAKTSAIKKGDLKEFKSEADLAATLANSRFTNTLARVTKWNDEKSDRLAQLAKKEVGEHHEKKEAKKIAEYLKEKSGAGHGHDEHAPSSQTQAKPATTPKQESHGGGHDDHGGGAAHH